MYQVLTTILVALTTAVPVYAQSSTDKEGDLLSSCTDKFAFRSTDSADTFLASILNPITVDDFFKHHFQQKAASAQRPHMPTYYGPMTSFEDVEYALENGFKISNPNQRLEYGKDWKLGKRVFRDDEYWTGLYKGDARGELGVEEAMSAVSNGFTVIMNGVQSSMPNVYQSAWQLETALGWHVNVNLYISPPGGSQGFEAHLDWMDGFIFQITGIKVSS
jgi:ribosomal protein L16 Arg81 hydroxylase